MYNSDRARKTVGQQLKERRGAYLRRAYDFDDHNLNDRAGGRYLENNLAGTSRDAVLTMVQSKQLSPKLEHAVVMLVV